MKKRGMELCKATSAKTEVDIPEKFIQEALEPRIAEAQTGKHARFFVKSNKKATWLLIFCMILWGMGWPSGQKIVHNISFDALIFWRFFIAFLALLPFLSSIRVKPRPSGLCFTHIFQHRFLHL